MRPPAFRRGLKYNVQRSEREYNWTLFRFVFLFCLALVIISVNIRLYFGNTLSSYVVLPLTLTYELAREGTLNTRDALIHHLDTTDDLARAEAKNRELRRELAEARMELRQYRAMAETWGLRSTLPDYHTLPATVIHYSADPMQHTVMIDRGSEHGLKRHMPVVVADVSGEPALVGRVLSLRPHTARVLLLHDRQSSVSAWAAGYEGLAKGTGRGCELELLEKNVPLPPGTVVYTSALGILFPEGLVIGRIGEEGARHDARLFSRYPVDLPYREDTLRRVLILTWHHGREGQELERAE